MELIESEEARLGQLHFYSPVVKTVGEFHVGRLRFPKIRYGSYALRCFHLLEQVAELFMPHFSRYVFALLEQPFQIVCLTAVYLRRNVGHLYIIHFRDEHYEGHG